jgi:hypothetical protein
MWHLHYEKTRFENKSCYPITNEDFNSAFARLLVGDNRLNVTHNYIGSDVTSSQMQSLFEELLSGIKRHTISSRPAAKDWNIDTATFLEGLYGEANKEEGGWNTQIVQYLFAASVLIKNRCFFMTYDDLIGIGPSDCRADDVIAVITGTDTPFVLRPVIEDEATADEGEDVDNQSAEALTDDDVTAGPSADAGAIPSHAASGDRVDDLQTSQSPKLLLPQPNEKSKIYTVVGECYVHGIMDGEYMINLGRVARRRSPVAGLY